MRRSVLTVRSSQLRATLGGQVPVHRQLCSCPYSVLGVSRGATPQDIRSKYISLAKQYHPDTQQSTSCEKTFAKVHAAYLSLSDPEERTKLMDRQADAHALMAFAHAAAKGGHADEGLRAFLSAITVLPSDASKQYTELASALFVECTRAGRHQNVAVTQLKSAWQWMISMKSVDASSCNAWFKAAMKAGLFADAMAAHRLAAANGLEQGNYMIATLKQINHYRRTCPPKPASNDLDATKSDG